MTMMYECVSTNTATEERSDGGEVDINNVDGKIDNDCYLLLFGGSTEYYDDLLFNWD
jgi:hypothetical protein